MPNSQNFQNFYNFMVSSYDIAEIQAIAYVLINYLMQVNHLNNTK
jgi:hypothetical protein